jgi:hypothetical protein
MCIRDRKTVDPHVPPNVVFNQDTLHTYQNATVGLQDTLLVALTATKTEDDLKSFNASVAYDGASTTTTFYNYFVTPAEYLGFTKEIQIITRNQAGSEKWVFSIVDRDGNITQKTFTLTVQ